MSSDLLHKDYHMDRSFVIRTLQQLNASQSEIGYITDALDKAKNPLEALMYIFRYAKYPEQIIPVTIENLCSKLLICLSGTEYYQKAVGLIYLWFTMTNDDIRLIFSLMKQLEKNGNPDDPAQKDRILEDALRQYQAGSTT